MREKVKFSEKTPVMVKLDFNDGTECTSRTGETQYQYTVDDDKRIMYVDPPIRNYILAEGARAGDVIRITKYGADARQWMVERALPAVRGAAAFPPLEAAAAPRQQHIAGPTAADETPAPKARAIDTEALRMAASFSAAIEATAAAEQYAAAAGVRSLTLSDRETITKVALSIYIQRAKDGR
jgi:hypothetical protein